MADETKPKKSVAQPVVEKPKLETAPDPQSPNALKSAAKKAQADKPKTETYVVLKPQFIDGAWKKKDDTVDLLEVQARHRVLSGKLEKK
ncbi:MAG: hypothetical protein AAFQ10_03425 [Pseudomonadota bacterium]